MGCVFTIRIFLEPQDTSGLGAEAHGAPHGRGALYLFGLILIYLDLLGSILIYLYFDIWENAEWLLWERRPVMTKKKVVHDLYVGCVQAVQCF